MAAASAAGSKGFQAFWNGPVGPKTIFFWAPLFKWCLVAAGLKDINRPADKISIPQQLALTATGVIWTRYSFVITPVNLSLAAVNTFVAGTGGYQLFRAMKWRSENPELVKQGGAKAQKDLTQKGAPQPIEKLGS